MTNFISLSKVLIIIAFAGTGFLWPITYFIGFELKYLFHELD